MKKICVSTVPSYDVLVGDCLFDQCGAYIRPLADRVILLTDDTVDALYGQKMLNILTEEGISAHKYVIPHGESSKTPERLWDFWTFLAQQQADAQTALVAFGGGVVGDLCGFAAATWHRGVPLVQIPTTLLAMVDASVGGKNALDLPGNKNAVGTFYQPSLVLCDPMFLNTLDKEVFKEGMGEVIKTAIIGDKDLLVTLAKGGNVNREEMIARCIDVKRKYVEADPTDKGLRHILNLGHTVGHAVESLSEYRIPHGIAVCMGIKVITGAALRAGIGSESFSALLSEALDACGVNFDCPYSASQLAKAAISDKKKDGDGITLVLPKDAENVILHTLPLADLPSFLEGGLQ